MPPRPEHCTFLTDEEKAGASSFLHADVTLLPRRSLTPPPLSPCSRPPAHAPRLDRGHQRQVLARGLLRIPPRAHLLRLRAHRVLVRRRKRDGVQLCVPRAALRSGRLLTDDRRPLHQSSRRSSPSSATRSSRLCVSCLLRSSWLSTDASSSPPHRTCTRSRPTSSVPCASS